MKEVTCILTSCGRFDLLEITLSSFFKFNTYDIAEFIIYEDSAQPLPDSFKKFPKIKVVTPLQRTGQITALDTLWQAVKTPYAFTMEDDWEFYKPGFIEASLAILETHPKIMHVWLTPLEDTNKHPIEWPLDKNFGILKNNHGLWSGTRFNPSLKRKSDYDLIAPFSKHTTFNHYRPWKSEAAISQVYHKLGFKAAILPDGYIKHIGEGRHVE